MILAASDMAGRGLASPVIPLTRINGIRHYVHSEPRQDEKQSEPSQFVHLSQSTR
jgi:hypothetical protein